MQSRTESTQGSQTCTESGVNASPLSPQEQASGRDKGGPAKADPASSFSLPLSAGEATAPSAGFLSSTLCWWALRTSATLGERNPRFPLADFSTKILFPNEFASAGRKGATAVQIQRSKGDVESKAGRGRGLYTLVITDKEKAETLTRSLPPAFAEKELK
ncbi:hypothetical protein MG293_002318 [Ovis ammon polii]|uniref:Large ribosomal subunit protein eL38 n=1 Tax=Ovis ammon polii TaxID=230172 RepID=A0AAD4UEJ2_OVIAM|nr:hypothetical protein MG293_002318 [Ovis ammon polii]